MDTKRFFCLMTGTIFFANGTEDAPMRNCHFIVALYLLEMCTKLGVHVLCFMPFT